MRLRRAGWSFVLTAAMACGPAFAQTTPAQAPVATSASPDKASCGTRENGDTRPRIGLALGGGGARGIAHISVLKELEALHIPVDCIAGTSMGALVGGLYASGRTTDDMEQLILSTDWKRLFDDTVPREERSYRRKHDDRDGLATVGVGISGGRVRVSPGVLQGERILSMFERETLGVSEIDDFDKLPIPFRAVGTDLNTGQSVVLASGSLPMAMRASMSLPGIFQPMQIDGKVLIDGGVANQVPIDVVRAMGADIVIAVDVGTPLETLDRNASLVQVVSQMSGMLTVGNTQRMLATLEDRDVLIVPKLGADVKTGDFNKAARALEIGKDAAAAARPELAALSIPPEAYRAWAEHRPAPSASAPVIQFVTLDNETDYSDEFLLSQLDVEIGQPLDTQRMEDKLIRVYSYGTFASITYDVVREDGRTGLQIHAREKPQGPNYIQVGFTLSSDFKGTFETSLRAAILVTPLTKNGAEGRVTATVGTEPALTAEYYRPFGDTNRWMTYTRIGYLNPNYHVFDADGHDVAEYDVRSFVGDFQFGREFGNYGAAGLGYQRATGRAKVETGDPNQPSFDFDTGRAYAFVSIDRADSLYFPRKGYWGNLSYTVAREGLGSDTDYDSVDFDIIAATPFDRHALQFGASYHATIDGELPIQDRYRLGGRGKLAGFRTNELTGQDYALLFVGYTYQLAEVFGRSALVGGTIEYGNAWEKRSDMAWDDGILNASMYLGFDSWFGPMLFGYGWREGGDGVLFLEIGRTF
ncbi:putative patatin-like phospholipase [Lysobacter dokdonensis DS-58]|uniref:Putative patatin-like phospholipase n=1 Tax=Lysobacter dokdonensis DS-58 TaxID=1300345 RepID=A0A0A2X0X6_9GAMM|nr:patatin-like phospholipase family protein [Lysobacter dokdonensis]KGQ18894.1 putative patatin-like phospholipase [Lysobacter dokdonensis DS-58]